MVEVTQVMAEQNQVPIYLVVARKNGFLAPNLDRNETLAKTENACMHQVLWQLPRGIEGCRR